MPHSAKDKLHDDDVDDVVDGDDDGVYDDDDNGDMLNRVFNTVRWTTP